MASDAMPAWRVAVFDLDGTLTRRDLFLAFLGHALRRLGPARPRALAGLPWLTLRHLLRGIGNDQLKEAYLAAVLGGRPRDRLAELAEGFAAQAVAREMKPAALARLARHRAEGDLLLLASASLDLYVEPIARRLGFDTVVATRIAWTKEGRVAGTLDGPNLRGPAKRDAVCAALARLRPGAVPRITAYSDHESDAALLALAAEPVAVDPTRRMARLAAERGWPVVDWNSDPPSTNPPVALPQAAQGGAGR